MSITEIFKMLVQIAILFAGIYGLLYYLRNTRGTLVLSSILILWSSLWCVARFCELHVISYILSSFVNSLWVILFIVFQSEIRRLLAQLGTFTIIRGQKKRELVGEVVMACNSMSHKKCGALIVFERLIKLQNFIDDAVPLDIKVNNLVLESIFFPNSPLHDGAVIIRDDRIVAACSYLPLTKANVAQNLGTRHRAALGISEESDAVVIVVSEETGSISIGQKGSFTRDLSGQDLERLLEKLIVNKDENEFNDTAQYIEQEESQEMDETVNQKNDSLILDVLSEQNGTNKRD